jgi:hypothetical protein
MVRNSDTRRTGKRRLHHDHYFANMSLQKENAIEDKYIRQFGFLHKTAKAPQYTYQMLTPEVSTIKLSDKTSAHMYMASF